MPELDDMDRYLADQNAPRRSAVFDIALSKAADAANVSLAEAQSNKKLLAQAQEAEDRNVFGFDAKKDSKGNYIEQGVGAKGNESASHFHALQNSERMGLCAPGSYEAALREIWTRDPKRAASLNLPKPA